MRSGPEHTRDVHMQFRGKNAIKRIHRHVQCTACKHRAGGVTPRHTASSLPSLPEHYLITRAINRHKHLPAEIVTHRKTWHAASANYIAPECSVPIGRLSHMPPMQPIASNMPPMQPIGALSPALPGKGSLWNRPCLLNGFRQRLEGALRRTD